jgi:hypothetical protein
MTAKENPGGGQPYRGNKIALLNFSISDPERQEIRRQSAELAAILIDLYKRFPLFFYEPAADDPDLDMERGFRCFKKRGVVL